MKSELQRSEAIAATLTLLRHLRDTRPVWTSDMPTCEGYFWMKQPDGYGEIIVVKVRLDYSEPETPFVVQVGNIANTGCQYLRDYVDCQWCGPLEMPNN